MSFTRTPSLLVIHFLAFCCLISCASLKDKARDFMEAGAYDQALNYYQMAVEKDPSDAEAHAGLNLARAKYIDRKLIDTRMARMGGNQQNAMDLLLDIVQKEKAWQFAPLGQIAGTQEEETVEALRFAASKFQQALTADRPLVALYFFRHYRPVFDSVSGAYSQSFKKVESKGKAQCGKLAGLRETGKPYFAQFVQKVCGQWGQAQKDLAAVNQEIARRLFNGVGLNFTVNQLPPSLRSEMDAMLQEAFRSTPWYNSSAPKKLPLKITGTFNQQHSEQTETLIHNYTVSEPYTAYESVTKTRTVPYTDSEGITRFREDQYTETEPHTRYRDVPRTLPYSATHHRQLIELSLDGNAGFPGESQNLGHQEKAERAGYQHTHNRPDIGLKPSDPGLIDTSNWFREEARKFTEKFRVSSDQYWSALFCKPEAGSGSIATTGEQVQKCLANPGAGAPAFAEQWYQAHFGISLQQAREISL